MQRFTPDTMRYLAHKPAPPLSALVDYLWLLSDAPRHARERIVPSATIELVVNLAEDEFRIYGAQAETETEACRRLAGAVVSGCYRASFGIDTREHASLIGVHFRPGRAAGFLGAPPGALADAHVALDALWGSSARALREHLGALSGASERFEVLERALLERLPGHRRGPSAVSAALRELNR